MLTKQQNLWLSPKGCAMIFNNHNHYVQDICEWYGQRLLEWVMQSVT